MTADYEQMTRDELVAELKRLREESPEAAELLAVREELEIHREETRAQTQSLMEIQRSLEESRDRYADLYDFAPIAYLTFDAAGVIVEINLTGATLLGVERSHVLGRPLQQFVLPSDRALFQLHLQRCRQDSGAVGTDLCLDLPEGPCPVHVFSKRCLSRERRPEFYLTAITDLSERKRAEEAARENRELLELAQAAADAGSWDWNLGTRELRWSEGLYQLFGVAPGTIEPTFENWLALIHPDDRDRVRRYGFCTDARHQVHLEYRILLPGGQVRWLSSKGKLLSDDSGDRLLGVTTDITHLKQTEQRLRELNESLHQRTVEAELRAIQLRAMASELTHAEQRERRRLAQILHDHLQQLLVASKMHLGNLRDEIADPELQECAAAVEAMLDDCLDASRSLTVELSPPILHDRGLVAALVWLGRWMCEKHGLWVEIAADETAEPGAEALRILLFEIVRELLFNIVKHAHTDRARLELSCCGNNELQLVVTDEGVGFDYQESRLRSDSTIGFGLSSVQHRLEILDGRMELETAPGQGTRITMYAPLGEPSRPPHEAEHELERPPAERGEWAETEEQAGEKIQVLLADDHKIVREGLVGLLESHADIKVVAEADDGNSVLELTRRLHPDVVIMDVNMPGVNGLAATYHINAEMPEVQVIGLSMHNEEDMAHAMFDAGAVAYLAKGGPVQDLVDAIRAAYQKEKAVG